jgi:hypothetical protein
MQKTRSKKSRHTVPFTLASAMTSYSSVAVCSYRLLTLHFSSLHLLFEHISIFYEKKTYAGIMYNCIFKEFVRAAGFYYKKSCFFSFFASCSCHVFHECTFCIIKGFFKKYTSTVPLLISTEGRSNVCNIDISTSCACTK